MSQRPVRFAPTGYTMRMMERVAAAVAGVEPVLLVGETGTGKTTLVQEISQQACCELACSCSHYFVARY